jgi:hypothetical protein
MVYHQFQHQSRDLWVWEIFKGANIKIAFQVFFSFFSRPLCYGTQHHWRREALQFGVKVIYMQRKSVKQHQPTNPYVT